MIGAALLVEGCKKIILPGLFRFPFLLAPIVIVAVAQHFHYI